MKEILYNYEEFKNNVDTTKPIHHSAKIKTRNGFFYQLIFRLYGVNKNNSNIIIFEAQKTSTFADPEQQQKEYLNFVEKYAKPFGSTEGALVP
ncbi:MAG: hypothetical protein QXF44_02760 [Candidatus Bathyarchaeia archaeon]